MQATILTIGDEILIGQIVDTNSVSIAKYLNAAGVVVHEKCSIGDDRRQIIETLERSLAQSDIVILTGGLGPTKDDITKKTLAEMFHSRLVVDPTVEEHVRRMLEARGIDFNELNRGPYISDTLRLDETPDQLSARIAIYRMMRPGESVQNAVKIEANPNPVLPQLY